MGDVKFYGPIKSISRTNITPSRISTTQSFFDDKNRLLENYNTKYYDERTELIYEGDKMVKQIMYFKGRPEYQEIYIYDEQNRLTLNRSLKNDSLVGGRLYEFKNDKLVRYTQLDTIDFHYSIRYAYNDDLGITEAVTVINDTIWLKSRIKKFELKRKVTEQSISTVNDTILREVVSHLNKNGDVIWRREFEKGKEIRGRKYKYRDRQLKKTIVYNGSGSVQSKTIYDSKGNFLKEVNNHSGKTATWKNVYDHKGNLVHSIKYRNEEFIEENRYFIVYR